MVDIKYNKDTKIGEVIGDWTTGSTTINKQISLFGIRIFNRDYKEDINPIVGFEGAKGKLGFNKK